MKLLDWLKIDNDKTFQRLINDVFSLEINNPGFIYSNPYIGKDGGWDGMYNGLYMEINGLWSFQSKYTNLEKSKAYESLKQKIPDELKKSKNKNVDNLVIITNANLDIDKVISLISLNDKHVKNFFIWPRENIESKINNYPWIRYKYFNDIQQPTFYPVCNIEDLENIDIERKNEENLFSKFLIDDKNKIMLIHANGGYGKSYFIKQLFKKYSSKENEYVFLYCQPGINNIRESINNEIDVDKNVIIFLDDAERYIEETKELVLRTKIHKPGKIKLVLSTRTSGKQIIKDIINFEQIFEFKEIELQNLKNNELIKIINFFADKKVENPEKILNEVSGNLFLLITIAKLISNNKYDINTSSIKSKIKTDLEYQCIYSLKELFKDDLKVKYFLKELALIVPFRLDNDNLFIKIESILNIEKNIILKSIKKLVEEKILINIGYSIRFNSDMIGDIYLSTILDGDKDAIKDALNNWFELNPEKTISNISSALMHTDGNFDRKPINELILKISEEANNMSEFEKYEKLKYLDQISYIAPNEIIDLLYCFLENSDVINMDTFGRSISTLMTIQKEDIREKIFNLIVYISTKETKGTYHNYKIETLIKQFVSPIYNRIDSATNSLLMFLGLVKKNNLLLSEAKLISYALEEALSATHDYQESFGIKMTFYKKILNYSGNRKKEVDKYKDSALNILFSCIDNNKNKNIQEIFISLISNIGYGEISKDLKIWKRIISDKQKTILYISDFVLRNKNIENSILASMEDVLIREWSNNNQYDKKVNEKISKTLHKIERTPEYLMYKNFSSRDIIVYDFDKIEKEAPAKDRWTWLVYNHFRDQGTRKEEFDNVVKNLSEKYLNSESILIYLENLNKQVENNRTWQYIRLIESWYPYNKNSFLEIINNNNLFKRLPEIFHMGIYTSVSEENNKYVEILANKILNDKNNIKYLELDILLTLIDKYHIKNNLFIPWILEIIESNSSLSLQNIILHRSYFIFKDRDSTDKNDVLKILEAVIDNIKDNGVIDMFGFALHNALSWGFDDSDFNKIREKSLKLLMNVKELSNHSDDVLEFAINNNISVFIDFLNHRILKNKEFISKKDYSFTVVPYNGFKFLNKIISTYNDFCKILEFYNSLIKQKSIYSFEIKHLLEGFDDYKKMFIEENMVLNNRESLEKIINILYSFDFNTDSYYFFLEVLIKSEPLKLLPIAKDLFFNKIISGSYSSNVGEAPPLLLNKIQLLDDLIKKCPNGSIKLFILSVKENIKKQIDNNILEGQELINPK